MKKFLTLCVAIYLVANNVVADVDEGLIVYYPFDGNMEDATANGHDGVVNTGTVNFTSGIFGQAASFNEGSIVINNVEDIPFETSSRTISVWAKMITGMDRTVDQFLVGYGQTASNQMFAIQYGLGESYNYGIWLYSCGNDLSCTGGYPGFIQSEFYHLVATYDEVTGLLRFFVNGQEIERKSVVINTAQTSIYIGGFDSFFFSGLLDDLRIYNRALSECEILSLYTGKPECACVLDFENVTHPYGSSSPFYSCYEWKYPTKEACEMAFGKKVHIPFPQPEGQYAEVTSWKWYDMTCAQLKERGIIPQWVKLLATGVELKAIWSGNQVDLELTTLGEEKTARFLIFRGKDVGNGGILIRSVCEFRSGRLSYTCTDNEVGETYRVVEVEYDGDLIVYDEVKPKKKMR